MHPTSIWQQMSEEADGAFTSEYRIDSVVKMAMGGTARAAEKRLYYFNRGGDAIDVALPSLYSLPFEELFFYVFCLHNNPFMRCLC